MKRGKRPILLVAVVLLLAALFFIRYRIMESFPEPPLLEAKAEELKATHISATLDAAIQPGTNLLWCGSFQLAWNEAIDTFGALDFVEDTPVAAALNRKEFTKASLDEGSYVAIAGPPTPETLARIDPEGRQRLDLQPTTQPEAFLFYARLFKDLAFEKRFERMEQPLVFGTNAVAAFGIERYRDTEKLRAQVRVLDYQAINDFIVELITKSPEDRLILAKVPPKATLMETIDEVSRRSKESPAAGIDFLRLVIPKSNFDLDRTYGELIRKRFVPKRTSGPPEYFVRDARQVIQFRLDERGARLKSFGSLLTETASVSSLPPDLIFDQPFLVLMQRVGAPVPYFAMWIDNDELLVPWKGN